MDTKTVTLSTKHLPVEIGSFEDFVERALSFDFYTDMSDDESVYQAGRRRRELMDSYAATHPVAGKQWATLCSNHLEQFMLGQLMPRVEAVVLDEHAQQAAIDRLGSFLVPYLCTTGRETMMAQSVRDAIAKKAGAPPSYAAHRKDEREAQIDEWILNYRQPAGGDVS